MSDNGELKKEEPIKEENKIQFPVTVIEIKQEENGEIKLYTKLIPPLLIYNMVLMLFSVVNNILNPRKNMVQLPPKGVFHGRLGSFLKGK